jgi:uncharacterized SAM-binding protein YcdF (DUF218 family)
MITKFIEPWVLFPGNVIILLLVLATLLFRTRRKLLVWGRPPGSIGGVAVALTVTAVLLYLFAIDPVSRTVMGRLETAFSPAVPGELRDAEAVVVLGGGVTWNSPAEVLLNALDGGEGEGGEDSSSLSVEAESRLLYGVRLARRLGLPLVVSGGRVLSAPVVPPEAEVAARLAVDLGVPAEMVLEESASRTTGENARLTRERYGFDRVILVTSAYHMRRSLFAFSRAGMKAVAAPAAYRSDRRPLRPVMFMPDATSLRDSTTVLRERLGYLWYRVAM